jgi:hypothetical protein
MIPMRSNIPSMLAVVLCPVLLLGAASCKSAAKKAGRAAVHTTVEGAKTGAKASVKGAKATVKGVRAVGGAAVGAAGAGRGDD